MCYTSTHCTETITTVYKNIKFLVLQSLYYITSLVSYHRFILFVKESIALSFGKNQA